MLLGQSEGTTGTSNFSLLFPYLDCRQADFPLIYTETFLYPFISKASEYNAETKKSCHQKDPQPLHNSSSSQMQPFFLKASEGFGFYFILLLV